MSAKQLEDFIRVIETAEKMSNRPESSIWSYPTDVFTRTSSSPRRHAPKPSPPPSVPRLWDPKISSELLSSSWGSRSSCKSTPACSTPLATSATATSKSSSKLTTVRSVATSTVTSARKSQGAEVVVLEERKDFNTLMNMQRHNRFARRVAKDLLSSMSPTNSPRPARKAASSSKSPNSGRRSTAASKSPSAKVTPEQTPQSSIQKQQPSPKAKNSSSSSREKSMSPKQKRSTASSSSIEEVFTSSPKEQSVTRKAALVRSVTIKHAAEDEEEVIEDLVEEEPRPLPQPRARPRVNIKEDIDQAKETKKVIRRPKSAPTPKKQQQQPSVDLRSYSKSFKLLGLDIPSNRTEATKVETINVDIKTKSPTMRTRLKERTGSVSDLRQMVDSKHSMPKEDFGKIQKNLSNAIFEEWYFSKMQELADKERQAREKADLDLELEKRETEEKKKKAAIEYQKWLEGKIKLKKMKDAKVRKVECQVDIEERKAKILKAEEEWKMKKAEEHKKYLRLQRRLQKKEEQEAEKQRLKKEEAAGKFNQWQAEWKAKIKAKIVQDKKKKLEDIEANRAEAKEKKESAELAFKAWKAKKVEERKNCKKSVNLQEKKSSKERLEAARDAYDNWLEYVEQREEEERLAEEERVLREMWRPPWYPPGIAEF